MKYDNAFHLLTKDPHKAKILKVKADLMIAILEKKEQLQMTQTEFAELAHTTQPKISKIANGQMSAMSMEFLMVVASRVGA